MEPDYKTAMNNPMSLKEAHSNSQCPRNPRTCSQRACTQSQSARRYRPESAHNKGALAAETEPSPNS